MPPYTPSTFNFLESVEAAHSSHSTISGISAIMGLTEPPIRMDSQAKYGCLARGDGGAYVRMPTGAGYKEKIWVSITFALWVDRVLGKSLLTLLSSPFISRRTMQLVPFWSLNLVELSPTRAVFRWISGWAGRWEKTTESLRR